MLIRSDEVRQHINYCEHSNSIYKVACWTATTVNYQLEYNNAIKNIAALQKVKMMVLSRTIYL